MQIFSELVRISRIFYFDYMEIASHLANLVVYSVVELHKSGLGGSPGISIQGISRSGTSGNKLD